MRDVKQKSARNDVTRRTVTLIRQERDEHSESGEMAGLSQKEWQDAGWRDGAKKSGGMRDFKSPYWTLCIGLLILHKSQVSKA